MTSLGQAFRSCSTLPDPCQPWARGPKELGECDHRAPLLDQVVSTIRQNRPLAFLMGESNRVATYRKLIWWQARVAEFDKTGYMVTWIILHAKHHGVPQNRPRFGRWAYAETH